MKRSVSVHRNWRTLPGVDESAGPNPGAKIVTLCDVWDRALAAAQKIVTDATIVKDYRTVLDRKDIDAVRFI